MWCRGEERIPSSRCQGTSGQFRLGVGPGLDGGQDGVIAVGGDPDLLPAEGHVVDLPACVMALERRREGVFIGNMDGVATHRGCESSICGDGRHCGIEGRYRGCTGIDGPDNLCLDVLVLDPCGVPFPALGNRVLGDSCDIIRSATPGIAGDDPGDQGVEGRDVCNRRGQFADCGLGDTLLDKISHFVSLPPHSRAVSR